MARIRTLKPELLEDEKVAALSDLEFRVFVSSILLADDYGNFRAHPDRVRAAILWGHPESDVASVLLRLAEVGLIDLYEDGGQRYAHLSGWEKHQKVTHPGKPLCPRFRRVSGESPETLARPSREPPESLTTDHDQYPDQDQDRDQDFDRDRRVSGDSHETLARTNGEAPGGQQPTITIRTMPGSEKTRQATITAEMVASLEEEFPKVDVRFEISAAADWALTQLQKPRLGKLWVDPMLGLRYWMRRQTRDVLEGRKPGRAQTTEERVAGERRAREAAAARLEAARRAAGELADPEAVDRFERARRGEGKK
jgi:hypothetical protein